MEKHYLEEMGEELALALGQAVWAFAKIEWISYLYLNSMSYDQLDVIMDGFAFRTRTNAIGKLIEVSGADSDVKDKAVTCIKKAEKLSEQRNLFVHNPWQIWVDLEEREFRTQIERYMKEEKKMDLAEIRVFAKETEDLGKEMTELLPALTRKHWPLSPTVAELVQSLPTSDGTEE